MDSNFYNCINFVTLRQELFVIQQSIEIYRSMYSNKTFNEVYLSPQELKQYILQLEKRKIEIIHRVRAIA